MAPATRPPTCLLYTSSGWGDIFDSIFSGNGAWGSDWGSGFAGAAGAAGAGAVSYTHLDVYKRQIAAGLASATTATERAALVPAELVEAIHQLKTQRDAVILAHYYVAPEVQAVADYVGDSFYLAKLAKSLPQQTIVLCLSLIHI